MGFQSLVDFAQHEVDEGARLPCAGAGVDGIVVFLLVSIHHVLYGQMLEERMQLTQDERLPQTTCAPVAIDEGMDELTPKTE